MIFGAAFAKVSESVPINVLVELGWGWTVSFLSASECFGRGVDVNSLVVATKLFV